MRHKCLLLVLALLILLPTTASRSDAKGDINLVFGFKQISDFADLQESINGEDDLGNHFELGAEMTFRGADWPIGIAVDILGSTREDDIYYVTYYLGYNAYDLTLETSTAEIDIGIRKIWELPKKAVRPYIGGGLSLARGEVEVTGVVFDPVALGPEFSVSESVDAMGAGFWIGGGVFWRVGQSFNIGLNARYSTAEVEFDELGEEDVDVGGLHGGLLLGWGW